MPDPNGIWTGMEAFLRGLPARLPERPSAILIVSGHWETKGFAFTASPRPPLIYDYHGFPPHTYELSWPAPGDPALAERAADLLRIAGYAAATDPDRGIDHGVFVPLKVAFPMPMCPSSSCRSTAAMMPRLPGASAGRCGRCETRAC